MPGLDLTSNFPPLSPPQGVVQRGGGGGGSDDSIYTRSTLRTELAPGDLEEHYRAQLLDAGWSLENHAASGRSAWSTWDFTDDRGREWVAFLLLMESPGEDELFAVLHAFRAGGQISSRGDTQTVILGE